MIFQVESPLGSHFVEARDAVSAELVAYRQAQYSEAVAYKLHPRSFRVYHQLSGDRYTEERLLRERLKRERDVRPLSAEEHARVATAYKKAFPVLASHITAAQSAKGR